MFHTLPYPQIIATSTVPSSNGKYLDSAKVKNRERKDVLKLRCGTNAIRIVRRLLIERPGRARSKCESNASVSTTSETELVTSFEAKEAEEFSIDGQQRDDSNSVLIPESIERCSQPFRIIYKETKHGFVAHRIVEDAGSPLLPAVITHNKFEPTYPTIHETISSFMAELRAEEQAQQAREHVWRVYGADDDSYSVYSADEFGVLL
ncbi:hypothetical protein BDY19DRAFT_997112 [Irpex rosettiformis]|uniref:Uncharacterized protein n=1 Tax=Irpex rosettiformis TaxID=378272 RepID=A0ACB8TSS4_9APHY|nr:hypothetical protein BDY19DRAFT_997112 [Irpex rosettiformis]